MLRFVNRLAILATVLALQSQASLHADPINRQQRTAVLTEAARMIETRYSLRDRAASVAAALRADAAADRFRDIAEAGAFADAVSARLQEVSRDGHLALDYAPATPAGQATTPAFEAAEMERWYGAHLNHGFEKIERLPGNIGYLDLRVFAPNNMAGDVTAAAMTILAQSDALIIDLRQNGGGSGIALMAAYLFDGGTHPLSGVYDRVSDKVTTENTPQWVPGRRFGSTKPVYILTSRRTFSAAEAFAYDLQALRRATIVGEPSGGGANPFEYRPIGAGFFLSLSEQTSINPITGGNWQDVGVRPDLAVPADQALQAALAHARERLGRNPDGSPRTASPQPAAPGVPAN